jgi:hypothetical protein
MQAKEETSEREIEREKRIIIKRTQRQRHTLNPLVEQRLKHSKRAQGKRERGGKYFVEATHWRQEACARW